MKRSLLLSTLSALPLLVACGEPDDHGHSENELITTVTLTFTPTAPAGGTPVTAVFDDPDGDGGAAPTVDPITLAAGTTYAVTVAFENRLETPAEDITAEVRDEAADHQVFFTGSAVDGPAAANPGAPLSHSYADTDPSGLPIGLANTIVAATGTGDLVVTLQHVPPVNEQPVKTATLAEDVKAGGIGAIGGDTDATATFPVTVP